MQKSIALILLMLSVPAVGQPAPKAEPAQDPNKVICKAEETVGTRLGSHRVCKTAADWTADADANRESAEDIRQRTSGLNPPDGVQPTGGFGMPPSTTQAGGPH
jgi:hypothetical protein